MALIQASIFSKCLRRTVRFKAIVPLDGLFIQPEPAPVKPFKTLYLLHGYSANSTIWLMEGHPLMDWAQHNRLAIVMPEGENHFYVDDLKRMDMYGEFIGRELIEMTRSLFPLSHEREDTLIGGISMGGFGALRNGMKYSDVFGHVIGISPANVRDELVAATDQPNHVGATRGYFTSVFGDLDTVEQTDRSLDGCARELAASSRPIPDIYFACGYNDILVYPNRHFHQTLTELGIPHLYEEGPGSHMPDFFTPHLTRGITRAIPQASAHPVNPFWIDASEQK